MKTAQKIIKAIGQAKSAGVLEMPLAEARQVLNQTASDFKIEGLLITNRSEGFITGWTARMRVTA